MRETTLDLDLARRRGIELAFEAVDREHDLLELRALEHLGVHVFVAAVVAGLDLGGVDHDLAFRLAAVVEADLPTRDRRRAVHLVHEGVEQEGHLGRGWIEPVGVGLGAQRRGEEESGQQGGTSGDGHHHLADGRRHLTR